MAITDYVELAESGGEDLSTEKGQGTRRFVGPWKDRIEFMSSILGTRFNIGGIIFSTTVDAYPDSPKMYAISAKSKFGGKLEEPDKQATWEKAIIDVTYETLDYDPESDDPNAETFITEAWDFSGQFITMDKKPKWTAGPENGKELEERTGKFMSQIAISLQVHRANALPAALLNHLGKINTSAITLPVSGVSVPTEQGLYHGASASKSVDIEGKGIWTYQVNLLTRAESWNKLMASDGNFYTISPAPYQKAALTDLYNLDILI